MTTIQLNGQHKQITREQSLKSLVDCFCQQHSRIVAEVNGEIIKSGHWDKTLIKNGDVVELVSFVGGG